MKPFDRAQFWITNLSLTLIVNLIVMIASIQRWIELRVILWRSIWLAPLFIYISVISLCAVGIYLFVAKPEKASNLLSSITNSLDRFFTSTFARSLAALLAVLILFLIPLAKFQFQVGEVIKNSTIDPDLVSILFYWFVWWLLWTGVGLTKAALRTGWIASFAVFTISAGLSYELYNRLIEVNAYPFSLGWSEASRYYYGSLIFSKKLYDIQLPASILHPTRYLLQSIPFIWNDSNLLLHRAWQFALWISMVGTAAWAITSKILNRNTSKLTKVLITLWMVLFFLKIGVYYHLAPIVFIPLFFYSPKKPINTLIGVILGSIWAGISRVNWIPVPALLITVLYVLDSARSGERFWKLFKSPILWGIVGILTAFASQTAYIRLSGNAGSSQSIGSSFTSSLLFDRLLPSDSNPLGVLLWISIYALPLVYMLLIFSRTQKFSLWQQFTAWAVVLIFLLGGLLVSAKIGGGADLHNMDAFAVFLVVIALIFYNRQEVDLNIGGVSWGMLVWALITPLIFTLPNMNKSPTFHAGYNDDGVKIIKNLAEEKAKDGEVLFINERHLVTFGVIEVPLVPEYEVVTLMEMVMSGNQTYLNQFRSDIDNQRFSAIISAKLNTTQKTEGMFFEENNLWNALVASEILCYYEPLVVREKPETTTVLEADETKLEFLVPKAIPGVCN